LNEVQLHFLQDTNVNVYGGIEYNQLSILNQYQARLVAQNDIETDCVVAELDVGYSFDDPSIGMIVRAAPVLRILDDELLNHEANLESSDRSLLLAVSNEDEEIVSLQAHFDVSTNGRTSRVYRFHNAEYRLWNTSMVHLQGHLGLVTEMSSHRYDVNVSARLADANGDNVFLAEGDVVADCSSGSNAMLHVFSSSDIGSWNVVRFRSHMDWEGDSDTFRWHIQQSLLESDALFTNTTVGVTPTYALSKLLVAVAWRGGVLLSWKLVGDASIGPVNVKDVKQFN